MSFVLNKDTGVASFPRLTDSGVINGATTSHEAWGSMRVFDDGAEAKYQRFFNVLSVPTSKFLYMAPDHNDNVQVVTAENLAIYEMLNTSNSFNDISRIDIVTDAVITKESIPVVVTPADCVVACITGTDHHDGKRFVAVIHVGFTGALLGIVGKVLDIVQTKYSVDLSQCSAFVFPYIDGEHYQKPLKDKRVQMVINKEEWRPYLDVSHEVVSVDFGGKVAADLKKRVGSVGISEMYTYHGHTQETLYSHTYAKEHDEDATSRFVVSIALTCN